MTAALPAGTPEAAAALEDAAEWLAEWRAAAVSVGDEEAAFARLVRRFGPPEEAAAAYAQLPAAPHRRRCGRPNAWANAALAVLFAGSAMLFVPTGGAADAVPKLSPFTLVAFDHGDDPVVRYEGRPYAWRSIDGVPVAEVVAFAKDHYGRRWQKRVAEDLVEVLRLMGRPPGREVSLSLVGTDGAAVEVEKAALTETNRRAVWDARNPDLAEAAPAGPAAVKSDPPKLSPFTAVTFGEGDAVAVEYEGRGYLWTAVDGLAVSEVLAHARKTYGDRWQKRVAEDLVEVLTDMGRRPGRSVSLGLESDGQPTAVPSAAMTRENRQRIWRARNE